MSIQSETIEAYSVGDEEQILELMWTVFGIKKSRELWAWQFTGNEQGNAWITLAKTGEVLTGHYATIRFDLNLKGKRVFAGESCD